MLSIDVKVNGHLIGHAYVVNTGVPVEEKCLYKIEYHVIGIDPRGINFEVFHNPDDGAGVLCELVYRELNKVNKK